MAYQTKESFLAGLSAKIDSQDAWSDFVNNAYKYYVQEGFSMPGLSGKGTYVDTSVWWAYREKARLDQEVYRTSDVLDKLNAHVQHFLHVSTEDANMIAYTPDAQAGEKDKQIKTTLGRYMSKFFPLWTDHFIQDVVAEHLADLSDEVEFIQGSENIAYAYMNGVHSCMAKEFTIHPAQIYGTKHIALAVMRNRDGEINARCLVDHSRMVYIRNYGDAKLVKRLTKRGYKVGNWVGSTFKHIPIAQEGDLHTIVMPYLDANNSTGNARHCTVALIDGVLKVVDEVLAEKLRKATDRGHAAVTAMSTSGFLHVYPVSSSGFDTNDAVTGERINTLTADTVNRVHVNRVEGVTVLSDYTLEDLGFMHIADGNLGYVYADKRSAFRSRGPDTSSPYVLDTEKNRFTYSWVRLNPNLYPDQEWARKSDCVSFEDSGGYILRKDAMAIVLPTSSTATVKNPDGSGLLSYTHNTLDIKKYKKLHSNKSGDQVFCDPRVRTHKTPSGRTVAFGYNEVAKDIFGVVDFNRNQKTINIGNVAFIVPKSLHSLEFSYGTPIRTKAVHDYVNSAYELVPPVKAFMTILGHSSSMYVSYKGRHLWAYEWPWLNDRRRFEEYGRTLVESEVVALYIQKLEQQAQEGALDSALWAKEILYRHAIVMSEAGAVEAPHYLEPVEVVSAALEATAAVEPTPVEPAPALVPEYSF